MSPANKPHGSIHQFVPMLHRRDAVGNHVLTIQAALRSLGVNSDVFVEIHDPETRADTKLISEYSESALPGDLLVYHFATASGIVDWLIARPEPLAVIYHNITPAESFAPWNYAIFEHQNRALEELSRLSSHARFAIGVSVFNKMDLQSIGFDSVSVIPLPIESLANLASRAAHSPNNGDKKAVGAGNTKWLTVGRLAPNKSVEQVIAGLFVYRRQYDQQATLDIIGRGSFPEYVSALKAFAIGLGLDDAVRFMGSVSDLQLESYYLDSDVLIVASKHEGFCVPLLEAMAAQLPIVARRSGAIPEVLGDAGIFLETGGPMEIAAAVDSLMTDGSKRADYIARGMKRLAILTQDDAANRYAKELIRFSEIGFGSMGAGLRNRNRVDKSRKYSRRAAN